VFGLVTRRDPATDDLAVDVPWVIDVVRWFGLVVVLVTVSLASPRPGADGPHGLGIAVALGLSAAAWIVWLLSGNGPWPGIRRWMNVGSLVVMAAAGGVLAGLSPGSPAVAVGCAACFSAAVRLQTELSVAIVAGTVATFLVAGLVTGAPAGALLGFPFAYAGLWSVGLTRRDYLLRAEQAERTLAETRRAREAEMHAVGQPVTLGLGFEDGQVTVSVANPLPSDSEPDRRTRPLAATGAGAGLTGLRERAALAGGTLEAGPAGGTWRVDLTIPA
jgi:hypothetical protein